MSEVCIQSQVILPTENGGDGIIDWIKEHVVELALVSGAAVIGVTLLATSAMKK